MNRGDALAGLLAGAGTMHVLAPAFFDSAIPPELPGSARAWTYGSAVAELGVAALLARQGTRRLGATAAAGLFVAVLPGNVQMLRTARGPLMRTVMAARLPLQVPLVRWALDVRAQA